MPNYDSGPIGDHDVVSHDAWVAARLSLLRREKEFSKARDEIARLRRALPWEKVEKPYAFDGPNGRRGGPAGGMPNGSRSPCTISTGTSALSSSAEPARRRRGPLAARRLQREGQAEHADGAGRRGGAAGDAGARRAAAGDERQTRELARAQVLDDRDPRRVELLRRSRRAPPGDAVGLLDERDADAARERDAGRGDEVGRMHAASGAVAEHERRSRPSGGRRCARAGPCGVSISSVSTPLMVPPAGLNRAAAAWRCPDRARAAPHA